MPPRPPPPQPRQARLPIPTPDHPPPGSRNARGQHQSPPISRREVPHRRRHVQPAHTMLRARRDEHEVRTLPGQRGGRPADAGRRLRQARHLGVRSHRHVSRAVRQSRENSTAHLRQGHGLREVHLRSHGRQLRQTGCQRPDGCHGRSVSIQLGRRTVFSAVQLYVRIETEIIESYRRGKHKQRTGTAIGRELHRHFAHARTDGHRRRGRDGAILGQSRSRHVSSGRCTLDALSQFGRGLGDFGSRILRRKYQQRISGGGDLRRLRLVGIANVRGHEGGQCGPV
mmetsp:Transcript_13795/g.29354  ORF Transcript_13795/g.29354 Transcript_13795/m.29354 type:complete len:284 (+) Transcript_13795:3-854(+)